MKNEADLHRPGGGGPPLRLNKARPELPVRLALSPTEAAEALSVSRDYFDVHVAPDLRIVRRGRRRLVPLRELERWLEREATLPLDRERQRCR